MSAAGPHSRASNHQRTTYEGIYSETASECGLPDPKIAGGEELVGRRVLSVGCGTGHDTWQLAAANSVTGLDYALSGVLGGRSHGQHGVVADLNSHSPLPFRDRTFDIVILKDVLEHLLDPLHVAREARRVLADDGFVVVSVPNHFYLPMRLRLLLGQGLIWRSLTADHRRRYDEWNYMHIRFFTYRGFRRFLREVGVRPVRWFWDFGNLAHYQDPDMWLAAQQWKARRGLPLSRRGAIGLRLLLPLWRLLNVVFPRPLRHAIVSLAPGLLCAGFYVRARKHP